MAHVELGADVANFSLAGEDLEGARVGVGHGEDGAAAIQANLASVAGVMHAGCGIGVEFEPRSVGEVDGPRLAVGGLVGLVIEVAQPVGLPEDATDGQQDERRHRVAAQRRLSPPLGQKGAGIGELLVCDAIEAAHLFPQGFGADIGFAMSRAGIQPDEKGALLLGAVLAIVPPGQPCGGLGLDVLWLGNGWGDVGHGRGCAVGNVIV